jgi:hypothetical protein
MRTDRDVSDVRVWRPADVDGVPWACRLMMTEVPHPWTR